jgi:hypothetical protein
LLKSALNFDRIGHDQLGRRAWSGRPKVSNEIGDGKIDLVADCRNDRNL